MLKRTAWMKFIHIWIRENGLSKLVLASLRVYFRQETKKSNEDMKLRAYGLEYSLIEFSRNYHIC